MKPYFQASLWWLQERKAMVAEILWFSLFATLFLTLNSWPIWECLTVGIGMVILIPILWWLFDEVLFGERFSNWLIDVEEMKRNLEKMRES